jgi:phage tail tape-measure protein
MSTARITIEVDFDPVKFKKEYADSTDVALELGATAVAVFNSEMTHQLGGNAGLIRAGIGQIRLTATEEV